MTLLFRLTRAFSCLCFLLLAFCTCSPVEDTEPTVSAYFPRTISIDVADVPAGGVDVAEHRGDWTADGYIFGWLRSVSGGEEFEVMQLTSEGIVHRAFYLEHFVAGDPRVALAGGRAALYAEDALWGEVQLSNGGWGREIPGSYTLLEVVVNPGGGLSGLLDKTGTLVLADVDALGNTVAAVELGLSSGEAGQSSNYLTRVQIPGGASIPAVVAFTSLGDVRVVTVNHGTDVEFSVTVTTDSFVPASDPWLLADDGSLWILGSSSHGAQEQIDLLQFTFDANGAPSLAQAITMAPPSSALGLEAMDFLEAGDLIPGQAGFYLAATAMDAMTGVTQGLVCLIEPGEGVTWSSMIVGGPLVDLEALRLGRPEESAPSNSLAVSFELLDDLGFTVTAVLAMDGGTGVYAPEDLFQMEGNFFEPGVVQVGENWLYNAILPAGLGHGLLTGNMAEVGFWTTNSELAGSSFFSMRNYGKQRLMIGMPTNEPALTSWTPSGPRGNAGCRFTSEAPPLGASVISVGQTSSGLTLDSGLGSTSDQDIANSDGSFILTPLSAPKSLSGSTIVLCP